ncbi:hypothetical protein [Kribbella sp. NPDC048928]|uniref:hypothetical protein n=1 Tax=Kribbella sp. NPDC048928 TaxID=3364111 RepID=UPI003721481E
MRADSSQPIRDQIDPRALPATLATGDVDQTLQRAATVIVEAADRANGTTDAAPDPATVAQVRGRMHYTMEQVQLGLQHAPPGENFGHRLGLAAADEGLYAVERVARDQRMAEFSQNRTAGAAAGQQTAGNSTTLGDGGVQRPATPTAGRAARSRDGR